MRFAGTTEDILFIAECLKYKEKTRYRCYFIRYMKGKKSISSIINQMLLHFNDSYMQMTMSSLQ